MDNDIYTEEGREYLLDIEAISDEEEAFMQGYNKA